MKLPYLLYVFGANSVDPDQIPRLETFSSYIYIYIYIYIYALSKNLPVMHIEHGQFI